MSGVILFLHFRVRINPQGGWDGRAFLTPCQARMDAEKRLSGPSLRNDLHEVTMSLIAPETSRSITAPPTTGSGKTVNQSSGGRLEDQERYRQQEQMYREKMHRIDDRIVSISLPHVRPIVRGKTGAEV